MSDNKTFTSITAWKHFKQVNDSRLRELERKGHADPLYDEHLRNIGQTPDASFPVEISFHYNEEPREGFTPTDGPIPPDFEGLGDADGANPVIFGIDFDGLP